MSVPHNTIRWADPIRTSKIKRLLCQPNQLYRSYQKGPHGWPGQKQILIGPEKRAPSKLELVSADRCTSRFVQDCARASPYKPSPKILEAARPSITCKTALGELYRWDRNRKKTIHKQIEEEAHMAHEDKTDRAQPECRQKKIGASM